MGNVTNAAATAKLSLPWQVVLYTAAALAVVFTFRGLVATGGWLASFVLLPVLVLLLPVVRQRIDPHTRYLPGAPVSVGISFALLMLQGAMFGDAAVKARVEREASTHRQSVERAAALRAERAQEYERDKREILSQVQGLLEANKPQEALTLANKFFVVTKDPDLVRLRSRAELAVMRIELQNEASLSLERREQIYKTLVAEEPGAQAKYQAKLREVSSALETKRKGQAVAAANAVLAENIKKQFSGWDGSHRGVEAAIKSRMHNPGSYEHVETRYSVDDGKVTIITTYRGTNGFGGTVTNRAIATVDPEGNVLSLGSL